MPPTKSDKPVWASTLKNVKVANELIAEPLPRSSNLGITTGLSLRDFPKSSIQMVREICLHYVTKCTGKYENNKIAGRYVHQMANEIMNQLAGVACEIKRNEDEPQILQALLDEWAECFPASLGNIGTPKAVAAKLAQQSRELDELHNDILVEKALRGKDVTDVLRSMDGQLHAARIGMIAERRQMTSSLKSQKQEFDHELAICTNKHAVDVESMRQQHHADIAEWQRAVTDLKAQHQTNSRIADEKHSLQCAEMSMTIRRIVDQNTRDQQQSADRIAELEDEIKNMTVSIVNDASKRTKSSSDEDSVVSLTLYSDDESNADDEDLNLDDTENEDDSLSEHDELNSSNEGVDVLGRPIPGWKKQGAAHGKAQAKKKITRKTNKSKHSKKKKAKQTFKLSGAVALAVKGLKDKIAALSTNVDTQSARISELNSQLSTTLVERNQYFQELQAVKAMNSALREALVTDITSHDKRFENTKKQTNSARAVHGTSQPLSHTPHLLGRADKHGLLNSHPNMTGCLNSGKY